jgi:hypothetical protein
MFVKFGICRLNGVVFRKVGGDVNVRGMRIEHFELKMRGGCWRALVKADGGK